MHISMIEPLAVSEQELQAAAAPLLDQGHTVDYCVRPLTEQEKLQRAAQADVLVIANSPCGEALLGKADRLKMLSVAFTGVDHVAMQYCRDRGVVVCNAQGYCTDAVAELTFGLIIDCLRHVTDCDGRVRQGQTKDGLVGHELKGKTVGIVGTGAIGCRVAELAAVFGCRVLGYSRSENPRAKALGVEYLSLDELLRQSDIVSLHLPGSAETKHLLNKEKIARMKPTAFLINVARGSVVDSVALAEALNQDRIAGAGIDVFEMEPPVPDTHPLLRAKHVVLTPHVAFATKESMRRRAEITFQNIEAWLAGTPVNLCR